MQLRIALFSLILLVVLPVQAEESAHPHHLGLALGGAGHDSETSTYLGLDYSYRFSNGLALFFFVEDVSGDFDVQAYGVGLGKIFHSGWKIGAGPGVEKKLKSGKTLNLLHISAGYDWHRGRWSTGPVATIDFIEHSPDTYYMGWTIGYGF